MAAAGSTSGGRLLEGQVAIVTGAGQGIGLAIAEGLAAHGADVLAVDVDGGKAHEAVASIEVDGGINVTTGPLCVAAGADVLVAGSFVYNDRAPVAENVGELRRALLLPGDNSVA